MLIFFLYFTSSRERSVEWHEQDEDGMSGRERLNGKTIKKNAPLDEERGG
jgi:hypothetical protein